MSMTDSENRALWIAAITGRAYGKPAYVWSGNNIVRGCKMRVSYNTLKALADAGIVFLEKPLEGGTCAYVVRWS